MKLVEVVAAIIEYQNRFLYLHRVPSSLDYISKKYERQWRKPLMKVRSLMRLGVHVQTAVACGITSKGPWRSTKTPGINQALSLNYLTSEGLYSLRDGWIALHHSK